MRFDFDPEKSRKLKADPERGITFSEAAELFAGNHYVEQKSDDPQQFLAVGWVDGKLYSLIYEVRLDEEGEYNHFVTLWKSTKEERARYAENS